MRGSENYLLFVAFVVFCFFAGFFSGCLYSEFSLTYDVLDECEKDLPRSQICEIIITAKIKDKDNE